MPELKARTGRLDLGNGEAAGVVALTGFIDAQNYAVFDEALRKAISSTAGDLMLDFTGVEYINSSGIGEIMRSYELCRQKGGELVLVGVKRQVGLTLKLLGVANLVPVLDRQQSAIEFFRTRVERQAAAAESAKEAPADGGGRKRRIQVPVLNDARTDPIPPESSVLVAVPRSDEFVEIVQRRLHCPSGRFTIVNSCEEAIGCFERVRPDLVVLDHRLKGAEDFLYAVKVKKGASLVSIINLYGGDQEINQVKDFKVWENDYLVEPFELMALFRLSEAELRRVPRDRKVLVQQVHFQFRTTDRNVEKANDLARCLIDQIDIREDDRVALFAALKEAVDNATIHGNRNDPSRTVDVQFVVAREKVTLIVQDEGEGFDYQAHLAQREGTQFLDEAKDRIVRQGQKGGLGILLMKRCVDRLEYRGRGNVVYLEKAVRR
ncbi:MAG: anti-sigma factor antagonist [Planctomycetes bacterium]|nr:anti-sigma factor antagonist [Planctomycetota bacterium]